jgi:hypothetical protein
MKEVIQTSLFLFAVLAHALSYGQRTDYAGINFTIENTGGGFQPGVGIVL